MLIGIPSYQDTDENSNPDVENISNAALGVRSALESLSGHSGCFRGVSVYAHWVTNDEEWLEYDEIWRPSSTIQP